MDKLDDLIINLEQLKILLDSEEFSSYNQYEIHKKLNEIKELVNKIEEKN